MPEPDVYSDRDAAPEIDVEEKTETETTKDTKEEGGDDDKSSESGTGLLSKSLFSGKDIKPGYKCSIIVDKIYDDQVSIKLAPHGTKSDDSEDESEVKEESVYD